jgi:hypothetical protein
MLYKTSLTFDAMLSIDDLNVISVRYVTGRNKPKYLRNYLKQLHEIFYSPIIGVNFRNIFCSCLLTLCMSACVSCIIMSSI